MTKDENSLHIRQRATCDLIFLSNKYLVKMIGRGSDTTNNRSGNPLNGNGSRFVQRKSIVKGKVRTLQPCRALVPKTLITGSKFEKVFSSRQI